MGEAARPPILGEFEIVREIGRGGMGVVYEAIQGESGRRVALKVVRGGQFVDDAALRLFRREIQALARLEHPGVASLFASGRTPDGFHYFAMELVVGTPLDLWLRRQGVAPTGDELERRLELFLEIADAVAYAHQRGVLHRDLKPSNLVVSEDGRVKVLDFGLARITDADVARATQVTELGTIRGTLAYMSPEQLTGNPDAVDVRADVYALGVVLYEMLAGEHPLALDSIPAFDIPRAIREEPAKSLRSLWKWPARLDPDLATIVAKSIEKDPARRYQSVGALADDLRRYAGGQPILARAPSAAYQLRKLVARNRGVFSAIAAVIVLLVGFGISMTVFARHLADERNRANREAAHAAAEMRATQQAAKVLSELVRVDLSGGMFQSRALDPREVTRVLSSIEARWTERPEIAEQLLGNVGVSLAYAGYYDLAIRFLERSVEIRRDVMHDPKWETAGRRLTLGEYCAIAGRLREADDILTSIVAQVRKNPAALPNDLAYALEDLGCVRRDLGRLDEAQALLLEAKSAYESARPQWLPYLASIHDSLGGLAVARGDLAGAELEHREALRLRDAYTPYDLNHVRSAYALGLVLTRRGKLAEAEPLLSEALARRTAYAGMESADVAQVLDALGELYLAKGSLDRADDALARALAAYDASLPPDNPARALALMHLGELRRRQGRVAEARDAISRARTIRETVLGDAHPDTVRSAQALAALPGTAKL